MHIVNAVAWAANAVVWLAYAHQPWMALASAAAAVGAVVIARRSDAWDYK